MGTGLLSPAHIAILLVILLLVFGARRLPELGRGLGAGMREFKDAVTGHGSDDEAPAAPPQVTAPPQQAAAPPAPAPPAAPSAQPVEPPAAEPVAVPPPRD